MAEVDGLLAAAGEEAPAMRTRRVALATSYEHSDTKLT